jgi:hypothetical protein
MKSRIVKPAAALGVLLVCAFGAGAPTWAAPVEQAWVTESNQHSQVLLNLIAKYRPEEAAFFGVEGHDGAIADLRPESTERFSKELDDTATALEATAGKVTDPRVKEDIQILVGAARDRSASIRLNRRLMLPYTDLPQMMFGSFHSALDPRLPKDRQKAALLRLRKYAGAERGFQPITVIARSDYEQQAKNAALVAPWNVEVKQNLENRARYIDGIKDLFVKSGLKGWEKDFKTLAKQLDDYNKWVESEVLPHARAKNQLPPEIYADNLKSFGVYMDPKEIMDRAFAAFMQTRDEMESIARIVAEKRGYKSADYVDVIRELKKERIPDDKLLEVYNSRLHDVEKIARDEKIITLPKRDAVIRLATEAESAAGPAPHLDIPRLIGNTGEAGEFVLPTKNPNAAPGTVMDDFNYDAITWGLIVHEARPGHELQFASMIENGVSIARAVFAFNSANAEGWGLYSEAIMKSYVPPEGQLGILQLRLMRAARAFLDPMLNLGLIDPDAAKHVLLDKVALSEPMAKQEIDRYTFGSPGQATSYFYGYIKLAALRTKVELALGKRFSPLAYHDYIMHEGLLPLGLLEQSVLTDFVKKERTLPVKAAAP